MSTDDDLRTRWIAALRSGKYRQARGVLRQGDAMCCLGVLCDVANPNLWLRTGQGWEYEGSDGYPPRALLNSVGIQSQGALANRNDGRMDHKPHTFEQIADFIEAGGGASIHD